MRILLLSKLDIQGCRNLNMLLNVLWPRYEVRVLLSDELLPEERGTPLADLCTWHDRDFILDEFFPFLDRHDPVGAALFSFTGLRYRFGVPIDTLKRGSHIDQIAEGITTFQPDVVYSCRFDYTLPQNILDLIPGDVFSTHSGMLPECRGPNASFQAMFMDAAQTACSLHKVTAQGDEGPLLARVPVPLDYTRCLFWNRNRIYTAGIAAFRHIMAHLEAGGTPCEEQQDISRQGYYPFPDAGTYAAFTEAGKTLYSRHAYLETLTRFLPPCFKGPQPTATLPGGSLAAWYERAFIDAGLHSA